MLLPLPLADGLLALEMGSPMLRRGSAGALLTLGWPRGLVTGRAIDRVILGDPLLAGWSVMLQGRPSLTEPDWGAQRIHYEAAALRKND